MNPPIILLTDFGVKDYFVGAMKGVILSINHAAKIIDITHEIPPQDITAASFTLRACYKEFPNKSIFVAVVDPGVGSSRKAILVETEKCYFITPDNGLLSFVFNAEKHFRVYELTNKKYFRHPVSNTFHGRDVFAPAAAHLANGVLPNKFGAETVDFIHLAENNPRKLSDHTIEAEIIHTDRFGNLITNLVKEDAPADFYVEINGRKIDKLVNFFASAEKNEIFMIFGSAGFLEIAAFQSSATEILNAAAGQKILLQIPDSKLKIKN